MTTADIALALGIFCFVISFVLFRIRGEGKFSFKSKVEIMQSTDTMFNEFQSCGNKKKPDMNFKD